MPLRCKNKMHEIHVFTSASIYVRRDSPWVAIAIGTKIAADKQCEHKV